MIFCFHIFSTMALLFTCFRSVMAKLFSSRKFFIINPMSSSFQTNFDNRIHNITICDAFCDSVPFVQFKKREKHPRKNLNFLNCTNRATHHICCTIRFSQLFLKYELWCMTYFYPTCARKRTKYRLWQIALLT